MSQSKPDAVGKNVGTTPGDLAFHFRAKDESLREVYVNESDNETESLEMAPMGGDSITAETEDMTKDAESFDADDKTPLMAETPEKHSHGSSEYKKMFKNLNEFGEKITRTFEEKISEIKHTSRSRILSSKENSSLSDSEDLSEGSRMSDRRSVNSDSPRKSPTPDGEGVRGDPGLVLNLEPGSELRLRKRTWPLDITKFSEEPTLGLTKVGFSDVVEVESAVEADEHIKDFESDDDGEYFDAKDTNLLGDDDLPDGEPPEDGELAKVIRFASDPKNKQLVVSALVLLFCIIFLPMSFTRGFLTCLLLVVLWYLITEYMRDMVEPHSHLPRTPFLRPDYSKLPPLQVPVIPLDDGVWFNEYTFPYDPDWYSVSHTFPVYMEIDKSFLKLSRPKGKINKRATFDEKKYKLEFINKRVFDLRHCRISLRPEGILRKRYFSKKYPIFIELMPGAFVKAVKFKESTDEEEEIDLDSVFKIQDSVGIKSDYGREYLNLFARCNRQKEEWFRRLQAASKAEYVEEEINGPSTPFENVTFDTQTANYEEYWEYMSKFVGEVQYKSTVLKKYFDKIRMSRKKKKDFSSFDAIPPEVRRLLLSLMQSTAMKSPVSSDVEEDEVAAKASQEVQWLSAVVNRILFDVFRTPYWLNKIQSKIQRKLASIRLPYYIEAVEIIELDLGKVGPRFHRISTPVLDERGLWFDLDLTFDGSFKMTLQTQLNLLKLQKGLEEEVAKLPDDKPDERSVEESRPKRKRRARKVPSDVSKISPRELMLEFAEIVVTEDSAPVTPRSSVITTDAEQSDSTESDEDDDEDDSSNDGASKSIMLDPNTFESKKPSMRRSSKRIFRVMESVAQSKYFKTIAETKYVQKAIAGVSATKLRLILEIKSCVGTLAINLPPPPLDRIWFGFRDMPKIWMSAQPMVGQKNFGFSQIRHFVERKIMDEIKKIIVMPNMDDLILPVPPKDYDYKMRQTIDPEPEKS